ncbi:MAG: hypothetical protein HOY69_30405, partial [Streptomyces sp.]|nr:hypothetical protein [Streptomyces sp.]
PEGPRTARDLGTVLERALLKVPGAGPGMPALANACAYVLCGMAEGAAPEELARLTTQVTYRPTLRILQAGLAAHGWGNRTPTARNV